MMEILVQLFTALLGTIGFALLFRVSRAHLPGAAAGGFFTYLVYELVTLTGGSVLVAAFASSLFMSLYSEALARLLRTSSLVFLLPSAIPIVPGGSLYYTLYNLLNYNEHAFLANAKSTLAVALGIAIGMSVSSIVIGVILQLQQRRKHEQ